MKILIATYPFGIYDKSPLTLLDDSTIELIKNPHKRRLKPDDMPQLMQDVDAIIAGTEPYDRAFFERHSGQLQVISRVGIGLDSIDMKAAQDHNVTITYTPEAPSQAVAELALAQVLNLNRFILNSDRSIRQKSWNRMIGWLISERSIGIIGLGRIGKILVKILQPFNPQIYVYDIDPDLEFIEKYNLKLVSETEIFELADIVSLHIPMNSKNHHFVNRKKISLMKTGSAFINTSRGALVDEEALTDALLQKHIAAAALDVFEKEPYEGVLSRLENVILTGHIGASARQARKDMEYRAAEDCIRVLNAKEPLRPAHME
ncbi:MAG: dehydrogenase [Lentisphaeria bacterium]|nr:dehydrogenase [Lentisphaeria bacterium]NQZ68845.1 dehydrogenase [Lentisphaeria bacterium]